MANNPLERVAHLISNAADLFVFAVFVAGGAAFFLPGIQARWKYLAASIVVGTAAGLIVRTMGMDSGLDLLAAAAGAVTGPSTLIALQGKTFTEAFRELQQVRRSGGSGDD